MLKTKFSFHDPFTFLTLITLTRQYLIHSVPFSLCILWLGFAAAAHFGTRNTLHPARLIRLYMITRTVIIY